MVRRLVLVLLIASCLLTAWNWSLLTSLLRPTLIRQHVIQERTTVLEQNTMSYGLLGIVAPVTVNPGTSPLVVSDWSAIRDDLRAGVSLAYEGESFAAARLAFLTGHSSDMVRHKYESVFAPLGQAVAGDTFSIAVEGAVFEYRVTEVLELQPTDAAAFTALAPVDGGKPRLVLVTCWPPLTTQLRLVVVGERL